MANVGVLGAGSWGTALSVLLSDNGHQVTVWSIDENEVKASHALSIGQPDEEQLYYLCSRGLSKQQAMGLLSVGYFLPVLDLVEDKELYESLRTYMESKVGLYGRQ